MYFFLVHSNPSSSWGVDKTAEKAANNVDIDEMPLSALFAHACLFKYLLTLKDT